MDNSNRQNRFRHKTRLSALGWATSLAAEMAQKQVISAREMMRIRGVYAYIINSIGNVAAVIGFHTLTVSVFEDQDDETPIKGFLRVDRWVYPMLRSFSPIFCWGPDKIILPDPFSSVGRPIYFVVRLPLLMTHHQKSTLWNLLDTCAHLRGQLSSPSLQEQLNRDKKFIHAMVTPFDNLILNQRAFLPSAEAAGLLEELGEPRLAFRRQALEFDDTATSVVVPPDLSRPSSETEFMNLPKAESGASSTRMQQPRRQSPLPKFSHKEFYYNDACLRQPEEELISNPGGLSLKSLPQHRGNVMRLYLLGPRDKQHIQVCLISAELFGVDFFYVAFTSINSSLSV
ncbi:unnamed protein product [Protopolystoma xenopodis]|uniref:Uncharacterized protein n=1 Tax=Protopolystoma xenopodis TaxID=117903 RepID=A0A3S5BRS1_9PLAT|nr:unnamed protein product [Protopolystoma xenopodis]